MNPSPESLLQKLQRFCAYQERCSLDVVQKLRAWKVPKSLQEKLLKQLKEEELIDDQRFANAFVRGKFRVNRWGRNRITYELRARQLSEPVISIALREIDEEQYLDTIRTLIIKKNQEINPGKTVNKREKIINFVVGKGFESDLVLRMIQSINI